MSTSSSSSAQVARQRLGGQLKALREVAGLSGVEFAARAGWADSSGVPKVEKGQRTITAHHVRLWCRVCGVTRQRTEALLAEQAAVAGMWVTYQQLNRGGLARAQESVRDSYDQLRQMRSYQSRGFPGLLQTEAYTRGVLETVIDEQGVQSDDREADLSAAVAERMDRQSVLHRPGKHFAHVMEESAVLYRTLLREVHLEQIGYVLDIVEHRVGLPSVSFGIIPLDAERGGMRPRETFNITDTKLVNVELVSGYLSVTDPGEVRMYQGVWDRLFTLAVHGQECAMILRRALERVAG